MAEASAFTGLYSQLKQLVREVLAEEMPPAPAAADQVSVEKYSELTGWSQSKIRSKLQRVWTEGQEFIKNRDGDILISISGVEQWNRNTQASAPSGIKLDLSSRGKRSDTGPSSPKVLPRPISQKPAGSIFKLSRRSKQESSTMKG